MKYCKTNHKCNANPKGSKAISVNDYRRVNARKTNCVKFPDSSFYIFKIEGMDLWKLGVSQNIERRFRDISNSMPFNLILAFSKRISDAYEFEERVHHQHEKNFVNNEWFSLSESEIVEIITDCQLWQIGRDRSN